MSDMRTWWKEAVVYQIYPRSFMDANGDGIGDLAGITAKLDYLRELGVDALWLSPIYQSPNVDNGYDISDYQQIMPDFGSMADFDHLLAETHAHGMRLIMDMVVNHTSDQHPWFQQARVSRDNPYRDFYIWHEGQDGNPPNNWSSEFGGSAWEYNEDTGDYYLHVFAREQPDLNWTNPQVRRVVYEMMRWWLDKGVDGFRLDVINFLVKAPGFPSVPLPESALPGQQFFSGSQYYVDQPGIHEVLQELHREVFSHYDIMTVGECHGKTVTPETGWQYVNADRGELDMMFHFDVLWYFSNTQVPLGFQRLAEWNQAMRHGGWTTITLNNHDSPRQVSSMGDDGQYRVESAKAIATLLLTAPGTPFIFQGEEIGMTNVAFASIDEYRDIATLNLFREAVAAGVPVEIAMAEVHRRGRDNTRTPMQWNASPHAGFTTGAPWIRVNPNYPEINVKAALEDPESVLHWYRALLRFRKAHPILTYGDFRLLALDTAGVYAYAREWQGDTMTVVINWQSSPATATIPTGEENGFRHLLLGTHGPQEETTAGNLHLRPWEARVYTGNG